MPTATSSLQQTVLKQGPLELYERGSFVARHVEVCLRSPDDPSVADVGCLVFRLKPARRELGGIELQSSLLSEAEQPDIGVCPRVIPTPSTRAPPPRCRCRSAAGSRVVRSCARQQDRASCPRAPPNTTNVCASRPSRRRAFLLDDLRSDRRAHDLGGEECAVPRGVDGRAPGQRPRAGPDQPAGTEARGGD